MITAAGIVLCVVGLALLGSLALGRSCGNHERRTINPAGVGMQGMSLAGVPVYRIDRHANTASH